MGEIRRKYFQELLARVTNNRPESAKERPFKQGTKKLKKKKKETIQHKNGKTQNGKLPVRDKNVEDKENNNWVGIKARMV